MPDGRVVMGWGEGRGTELQSESKIMNLELETDEVGLDFMRFKIIFAPSFHR